MTTHSHSHGDDKLAQAQRQIEARRRQKDKWMKESEDSPLDEAGKAACEGLNYYPIDFAYRVPATMRRDERPHHIQIQTTKGEWREYNHYGVLSFELDGKPLTLNVYQQVGDHAHTGNKELFVPFKDRTAPRETYGAGRYLDLRAQEGDTYTLDFNLAYNPWCAYSPNYSCTIPPPENHLPVEIRAGEKNYGAH
jgi:uncharacterized protein (DUF1684 family)